MASGERTPYEWMVTASICWKRPISANVRKKGQSYPERAGATMIAVGSARRIAAMAFKARCPYWLALASGGQKWSMLGSFHSSPDHTVVTIAARCRCGRPGRSGFCLRTVGGYPLS